MQPCPHRRAARRRSMPCASPPAARACCSAAISSCRPAPTRCRSCSRDDSRAIVNSHETITGDFTRNPDLPFPSRDLQRSIAAAVGQGERRVHRRDRARDRPARRFDREQSVHARLCLSAGPGAGLGRGDRAGDRTERGRGRVQPQRAFAGAAAPRSIRRWSRRAPCRPHAMPESHRLSETPRRDRSRAGSHS